MAQSKVVIALNGLLMTELTAINQYFLHYKMCQSWSLSRLAQSFKDASYEEMRDAEKLAERILDLGGLPNFQRLGSFGVGETALEQLRLALELETGAVAQLTEAIATVEGDKDFATATMLREMIVEEAKQVAWVESQLELAAKIGEQNYLALQAQS
jgi:bacterioferritin